VSHETLRAISNDGIRIAYQVIGYGPPSLLHHGFSVSGRDWLDDVVPAFRNEYQLIVIDARGHGASDKPHDPEAYSMSKCVSDILAVLDAQGIERTHFWGYSMGCRIGFGLGALAPERVTSSILGGSHPLLDPPERYEAGNAVLREGMEQFLAVWETLDPALTHEQRQRICANDIDALLACRVARSLDGTWESSLPGMTMPCLLFAGDQDEPSHTLAQRAAKQMPNAQFLSLPGCDHVAAGALSSQLDVTVRAFLARADASVSDQAISP
jgi:pimeloyl-ACP methyl ester carboxylesterase